MKTLVLGLGNPLLCDDGVGLRVAQELRTRLAHRNGVEVDEDYHGGLRLMERMIGYDRSIVVDAIQTGAAPGTLHRMTVNDLPTRHSASSHDATLATALDFGRRVGAHLPDPGAVLLIGVEAADVSTFRGSCTPQVAAAIPRAVQAVMSALDDGGTADDLP